MSTPQCHACARVGDEIDGRYVCTGCGNDLGFVIEYDDGPTYSEDGRIQGTHISDERINFTGTESQIARQEKASATIDPTVYSILKQLRLPDSHLTSIRDLVKAYAGHYITQTARLNKTIGAIAYIYCIRGKIPVTLKLIAPVVQLSIRDLGKQIKKLQAEARKDDLCYSAQQPQLLIELSMHLLEGEIVFDKKMSEQKFVERVKSLLDMACTKWLDTGRHRKPMVAAAIKIVSNINQNIQTKRIAYALQVGQSTVQNRINEFTNMLLEYALLLPPIGKTTKKTLYRWVPNILDCSRNMEILLQASKDKKKQQETVQVAPPAYVRNKQEQEDRKRRVEAASDRLEGEKTSLLLERADQRAEEVVISTSNSKNKEQELNDYIINGYYHKAVMITDEQKKRLHSATITSDDMSDEEFERCVYSQAELPERARMLMEEEKKREFKKMVVSNQQEEDLQPPKKRVRHH
jgi:transcription initiation factor TFIIIB Brf1 subunit/transcription initiation factor TFIIB